MRPALPLSAAAVVLLLAPTSPASAAGPSDAAPPADGPVSITLPACAPSSPVSEALVAECSYIALPRLGGGAYFAYPTSGGDVRLTGSLDAGQLAVPPSGQVWPGLPVAGGLATVDIVESEVTGTLGDAGDVTLTVPYRATIDAGPFGTCTVAGTAALSSAGTDAIGGTQGSPRDPGTGRFAVAGTAPPPTLQGSLCARADEVLDLSRGMGWYLRGILEAASAAIRSQTLTVDLPQRIKRKGRTVLLAGPLTTNAGQAVSPRVTWGTSRSANGSKRSQARVTYDGGRVVLRTFGTVRRLYVRLTMTAPPVPGFGALDRTRVWTVR